MVLFCTSFWFPGKLTLFLYYNPCHFMLPSTVFIIVLVTQYFLFRPGITAFKDTRRVQKVGDYMIKHYRLHPHLTCHPVPHFRFLEV